ncbi:hypothetical protein F5Y03DRAFT_338387, partial [Xylaria venustula]
MAEWVRMSLVRGVFAEFPSWICFSRGLLLLQRSSHSHMHSKGERLALPTCSPFIILLKV